jgi:hypothetical protein
MAVPAWQTPRNALMSDAVVPVKPTFREMPLF